MLTSTAYHTAGMADPRVRVGAEGPGTWGEIEDKAVWWGRSVCACGGFVAEGHPYRVMAQAPSHV